MVTAEIAAAMAGTSVTTIRATTIRVIGRDTIAVIIATAITIGAANGTARAIIMTMIVMPIGGAETVGMTAATIIAAGIAITTDAITTKRPPRLRRFGHVCPAAACACWDGAMPTTSK
jgi:hypothetical protein